MQTERIKKLRNQSQSAINKISSERGLLVTAFYKEDAKNYQSIPIVRAKCFEYILKHKEICINDGELIVGERGPGPKETSTYPEITLHSIQDLEILNSREKVFFKVDERTLRDFREVIIPFWEGRTNRDRIMSEMSQEWTKAYTSGVFTEFQEQRAPGHTVAGSKLFTRGILDIKKEIVQSIKKHHKVDKIEELEAMNIVADALVMYASRHADKLDILAKSEEDRLRKTELIDMARICRKVPLHAPSNFQEALQHYWFIHVGVITELNPWDSYNPGRLDQHLLPFYLKGIEDGSLNKEKAIEMLQSFWIKFNNHPAPPKIGVTALESNTYTDFCLINMGGLTPEGNDGVNEMSYILLDVIEEMRLLQPGSMIQLSHKNPDKFVKRALKIIKTGYGQPSIFNTDAIVKQLQRQGKGIVEARNGGASGCVETGAFGVESYTLTGYFNLSKILELTLNNGFDPRTQRQIGVESGDPKFFASFEAFLTAYTRQLKYFSDIKIEGNNKIERINATEMPVPFMSLFTDDCIANGVDYNAGGARYNTSYIQGVGTGSTTDSLAAIKFHVFDQKSISMKDFLVVMENNFKDYGSFRNDLLNNTPKYGNDDDYADGILMQLFEIFYNAVDGRATYKNGKFRINLLPTTSHVYFGSVIGALPDGRKAGMPLSEGISDQIHGI